MSDYPDWPLMAAAGVVGVVFLVIGLRAAFAPYAARLLARRAARSAQPPREGWDRGIAVKR